MTKLTQADITALLARSDKAVARALVVLNARQTTAEQISQQTVTLNGRGFQPCHARMGTSMAAFYTRNGYLSPKQLAYWRKPNRRGQMRVAVYWRQLLEVAAAKATLPVEHGEFAKADAETKVRLGYAHHLAEEEMNRIVREGERAQDRRDEENKFQHRTSMEVFTPFSASGGDR